LYWFVIGAAVRQVRRGASSAVEKVSGHADGKVSGNTGGDEEGRVFGPR
jgi:hypothetical protein